jgi:hypothetical protein
MRPISQLLADDVAAAVQAGYSRGGIINVPAVSEAIRLRHERENVALEDIAEIVMCEAQRLGAPMEFSSPLALADVHQVDGRTSASDRQIDGFDLMRS